MCTSCEVAIAIADKDSERKYASKSSIMYLKWNVMVKLLSHDAGSFMVGGDNLKCILDDMDNIIAGYLHMHRIKSYKGNVKIEGYKLKMPMAGNNKIVAWVSANAYYNSNKSKRIIYSMERRNIND